MFQKKCQKCDFNGSPILEAATGCGERAPPRHSATSIVTDAITPCHRHAITPALIPCPASSADYRVGEGVFEGVFFNCFPQKFVIDRLTPCLGSNCKSTTTTESLIHCGLNLMGSEQPFASLDRRSIQTFVRFASDQVMQGFSRVRCIGQEM